MLCKKDSFSAFSEFKYVFNALSCNPNTHCIHQKSMWSCLNHPWKYMGLKKFSKKIYFTRPKFRCEVLARNPRHDILLIFMFYRPEFRIRSADDWFRIRFECSVPHPTWHWPDATLHENNQIRIRSKVWIYFRYFFENDSFLYFLNFNFKVDSFYIYD